MKGANISIINLHLKMAFSPHLIGWDEINFHIQSPNFGSFSTRSVKLCCGSSFVALLCQGLGIPYMLGLPKPCNFTVGKNNRSLFHVLRDLYSPSAKSSVYHQCLGINTQHRLFAKIFWKAREFSCSISELWMSSVRVHWECLFPFLFCFWKMWCLFFFFSIFLIGVLRLISQCLLLFQNDQNIWKTPPLPPGLGSPKTSAFQRTKKAWCNSWFNQEWLGTSTSVPERRNRYQLGKLIFRNPVVSTVFGGGLVGAKSPCVYSVSKDIPGGQQDLFFFPTTVSLISLILDIYFMHLNFFQPVKKKHPRDSLNFWSTNLGTPWQKLSGGRACKSGLWCIRGSHIAETSFCRCPGL